MSQRPYVAWIDPAAAEALARLADDEPESWRDRALCAEADPDIWFPEVGGAEVRAAKKICRRCPVQTECLDYALERHEMFGIWGGLSYHERLDLRRGMADAA